MTPTEFRSRLRRWAEASLPDVLEDLARPVFKRWGARAIGTYTREGSTDAGSRTEISFTRRGRTRRGRVVVPPRSKDDRGPLRRVSGDTARALRGGAGAIERVAVARSAGLTARLTKGVDPRVAPGAYNEGRTAKSGRDLSFLEPAIEDERTFVQSLARRRFLASLRSAVRGARGSGFPQSGPSGGAA